jgi:hypothetical protein
MFDLANMLNSNADTLHAVRTGGSYLNIIKWLPGRTAKIGIRFTF